MPVVSKDGLRGAVREFLAARNNGNGHPLELDDAQDLFATGQIDSIGFLELLLFLAERTGRDFDLTDVDVSQLAIVGTLLDYFASGDTTN